MDSFVFYPTFEKAIDSLPDEMQLDVYKALVKYGIHGEEYEGDNFIVKALLESFKGSIDSAKDRRIQNAENGKKGGRPSNKPNKTEGFDVKTDGFDIKTEGFDAETEGFNVETEDKPRLDDENLNVYVNVNVNDNVNVKEKEKESKKKSAGAPRSMVRPSLDDVVAYVTEQKYSVDAQRFIDYYESCGWKVGNKPMKDWKAAVRTWQAREKDKAPPKKSPANYQTQERDLSFLIS